MKSCKRYNNDCLVHSNVKLTEAYSPARVILLVDQNVYVPRHKLSFSFSQKRKLSLKDGFRLLLFKSVK
jgi:hypothetical protein